MWIKAEGSTDNNNNNHLFSLYYVPGTVLSAFPYINCFNADNPLSFYYYPCFTDVETEAQRAK